jgi:hypothetical protein
MTLVGGPGFTPPAHYYPSRQRWPSIGLRRSRRYCTNTVLVNRGVGYGRRGRGQERGGRFGVYSTEYCTNTAVTTGIKPAVSSLG